MRSLALDTRPRVSAAGTAAYPPALCGDWLIMGERRQRTEAVHQGGGWSLWLWWVLATAAAELEGFAVPATMGVRRYSPCNGEDRDDEQQRSSAQPSRETFGWTRNPYERANSHP